MKVQNKKIVKLQGWNLNNLFYRGKTETADIIGVKS